MTAIRACIFYYSMPNPRILFAVHNYPACFTPSRLPGRRPRVPFWPLFWIILALLLRLWLKPSHSRAISSRKGDSLSRYRCAGWVTCCLGDGVPAGSLQRARGRYSSDCWPGRVAQRTKSLHLYQLCLLGGLLKHLSLVEHLQLRQVLGVVGLSQGRATASWGRIKAGVKCNWSR